MYFLKKKNDKKICKTLIELPQTQDELREHYNNEHRWIYCECNNNVQAWHMAKKPSGTYYFVKNTNTPNGCTHKERCIYSDKNPHKEPEADKSGRIVNVVKLTKGKRVERGMERKNEEEEKKIAKIYNDVTEKMGNKSFKMRNEGSLSMVFRRIITDAYTRYIKNKIENGQNISLFGFRSSLYRQLEIKAENEKEECLKVGKKIKSILEMIENKEINNKPRKAFNLLILFSFFLFFSLFALCFLKFSRFIKFSRHLLFYEQ